MMNNPPADGAIPGLRQARAVLRSHGYTVTYDRGRYVVIGHGWAHVGMTTLDLIDLAATLETKTPRP